MVLFDLPPNGLETLLKGCTNLKNLSLVVDRTAIASLCSSAAELRNLKSFEATIHIGVTGDQMSTLVKANALPKLTALKFHSKHTTVFNDASLASLVGAAPNLEYLELNGDDISLRGLDPVAKKLGKSLQSLLVHHVTLSNEGMKELSGGLPNLRELTITDMHQRGFGNRIRSLVCDRSFCTRLRKVELSSHKGFTDRDLARIPEACPNLQWIDFSFSFTYPETLKAITDNCPNVLYLRLCRSSPPSIHMLGGMAGAASPTRLTPHRPTSATSSNPTSPTRLATSPTTPTTPTTKKPKRPSTTHTPTTRRDPNAFLASSPECKSIVHFGTKGGRKLRVLDMTGNLGLTDWTLSHLCDLPALHTLFVDSCESVTSGGVVKFAEGKWRSLKRLHVKNCRGCRLGVVMENYLTRSLEVEVILDGGRVVGRGRDEF
ncbi:hypothetical protein HDV00_011839 [Rhizophlyctis rosea]|nr:hypothetical protein HDV00_011839 [Rhizophlyctis rosea]